MRELYKYRKEHGLCVQCGKPASGGTRLCEEHRQKSNLRNREERAFRERMGLCRRCGKEKQIAGSHYCTKCDELEYERMRSKDYVGKAKMRYVRLRTENRCVSCQKPVTDGKAQCPECRKRYGDARKSKLKIRYYGRIDNGLCPRCGKPNDSDRKTCETCRRKLKERYGQKQLSYQSAT
jgi:predicted amidophosphoribosyltransferase